MEVEEVEQADEADEEGENLEPVGDLGQVGVEEREVVGDAVDVHGRTAGEVGDGGFKRASSADLASSDCSESSDPVRRDAGDGVSRGAGGSGGAGGGVPRLPTGGQAREDVVC